MKKILSKLVVVLIFLLGIGLLAYPSFSNWWNEQHQSRAIAGYDTAVESADTAALDEMLAAAEAYNEQLLIDRQNGDIEIGQLDDAQMAQYNSLLDLEGNGVIGYIRIPKVDIRLPIYHGTDEAVLQVAVGHIEGSSLPVGGKGTHAVLSGHRGLPSAKLFTDIDSLGEGDVFMITCLGRKITYEVDQITTVLPSELQNLTIDPDEDYCTLVTCTPYGVNSHRLLVRGHRIENLLDDEIETITVEIPERELSDQERMQQVLPYVFILAAGFFALALMMPSKRKDGGDKEPGTARGRKDRGDRGECKDRKRRRSRSAEDAQWEERRQAMEERRRRRERGASAEAPPAEPEHAIETDDEQWSGEEGDGISYYDSDDDFYDED